MTQLSGIARMAAAALAVGMVTAAIASNVGVAQDTGLRTLRSEGLQDANAPPPVERQHTPADGFGRAYRQQPPLIPHRIDGYQVTLNANQCMNCHDWPTRYNAPKASETHYVDRQGVRLDKISGTRYFCTQCHVPQAEAKPLVDNLFQNATEVR